MRFAVISDVHSNLEALEAVLEDMDRATIHKIISLGDNIGYGADPEAVMDIIAARGIESVLGNHELACLSKSYLAGFNPQAHKALLINRSMLSLRLLDYLGHLPLCLVKSDLRFVHGTPPDSPTKYVTRVADGALGEIMKDLKEKISFVGHTHRLGLVVWKDGRMRRLALEKKAVYLDSESRYVVNAGSVSQPRDGNLNAKYLIWDSQRRSVEFREVDYDRVLAAEKMKKAGLPMRYAQKLLTNK